MTTETDNWYSAETATLGDRIAAGRDKAGMSQSQLSKRLGVTLSTLKAWENDVSEPRANRLSMLAGLLNVSVMWLLTGEGEGVGDPDQTLDLSPEVSEILAEIRDLRVEMRDTSDRLGRLEKKLRAKLKDA